MDLHEICARTQLSYFNTASREFRRLKTSISVRLKELLILDPLRITFLRNLGAFLTLFVRLLLTVTLQTLSVNFDDLLNANVDALTG